MIGLHSAEIVHPDDKAKTATFVEEMVAGKTTRDFRNQWVRKDGTIFRLTRSADSAQGNQRLFEHSQGKPRDGSEFGRGQVSGEH
ncbi:MAG: hypothetical protein H0X73_00755 [Chthoniobacterales bacterium]|nr:hypothetical protein [Chthoniobacterales bacterium]